MSSVFAITQTLECDIVSSRLASSRLVSSRLVSPKDETRRDCEQDTKDCEYKHFCIMLCSQSRFLLTVSFLAHNLVSSRVVSSRLVSRLVSRRLVSRRLVLRRLVSSRQKTRRDEIVSMR